MRYSTEEQMREIMVRKARRQRRRGRQTTLVLSGVQVCLAAACIAAVAAFSGAEAPYLSESAYGAFLLSSGTGSYVLCGVIAFVCGSLFTAACIRRKRREDEEKNEMRKREERREDPRACS